MSKDKKLSYAREYVEIVRPLYIEKLSELRWMMHYGTENPDARDEKFLNEFSELAMECIELEKRKDELGQKFLNESDD